MESIHTYDDGCTLRARQLGYPKARANLRKASFSSCANRLPLRATEAICYGFNRWDGLLLFLEDGRIEMDTNSVERANRLIAMTRRNSLFAGHDEGAANWACLASLIQTAKTQSLNPQAYLADILTKLVNGWPMRRIDELLPWAWSDPSKEGSGTQQPP